MAAHLLIVAAVLVLGGSTTDRDRAPGAWNGEVPRLPADECAAIAAAVPAFNPAAPRGARLSADALPTWRIELDYSPVALTRPSDAAPLASCPAALRAIAARGWTLAPLTSPQRQAHDVRPLHWISRAEINVRLGKATVWFDGGGAVALQRSRSGLWTPYVPEPIGDPLE